ncbi:MAG TPA: CBS domain-containing protein, partial [Blastocatellia bacterium]|nr:CBS domain-containing protein [Blastocatellia bacterium]
TKPPVAVSPELRVNEFIEQVLEKNRYTSFPVARDGRLHGMLSLKELQKVPQESWAQTTIREVMQPVDESLFVTARASIEHALKKLKTNSLGHLAVVNDEGILVGFFSDQELMRANR